MLIYTEKITPRIDYIFRYMLEEYLGIAFQLTESQEEFRNHAGEKLAYSNRPIDSELFLWKHPLMCEEVICPQHIDLLTYNHLPAFFPVAVSESLFPFDIIAASFYLLSRYEEYLPYQADIHGRFPSTCSLALKAGFLHKPIVNIWAKWVFETLQNRYPHLQEKKKCFSYLATYDIDMAYAYLHRGILLNGAGLFQSIIKGNFKNSRERILTLTRIRKDPFDTYDFQFNLQVEFNLHVIYFILCAPRRRAYDRNLPITNSAVKELINKLDNKAVIGIHPSFASFNDLLQVRSETAALQRVVKQPIVCSRQHFLRMSLPDTYQMLIKNDISNDYTMAYADNPGFRASVCTPFYFFDLEKNESSSLMVHPFTYMDATLRDYCKLSVPEAEQKIQALIDETKAVQGIFTSLWHNSSLTQEADIQWRKLYVRTLEYATNNSEFRI